MLKERLKNPGSYFRFGWQRETERVVYVRDVRMRNAYGVYVCGITKGMLDKREP